jgi:hypothetical protein
MAKRVQFTHMSGLVTHIAVVRNSERMGMGL